MRLASALIISPAVACISMKLKQVNTFAVIVILLIAVPEIVGHSLFERPHPAASSANAAVSLTDRIASDPHQNISCSLALKSDPSGANIARAAGLEGKYGDYYCV